MKVYKYITNYCSMVYAIPEFESVKPILERLHGKKITLYKVKNRICRETAVYYTLNDDEDEKLQKKLAISTKALKEYMTFCRHPAEEALKEMEGVK